MEVSNLEMCEDVYILALFMPRSLQALLLRNVAVLVDQTS